MTDAELIKRVLAGDKDSFAELVRRHHTKTISLCLSLLGNNAEAEDAAQDAFLKAYKALSSFTGEAQFTTWLYQITYHHCLDVLRKRTREKLQSWDALVEESGEQIQDLLSSPENMEQSLETKDLVRRVLKALPEDYRNILIIREINGLTYEEISAVLRISMDAVKGRLKRARADLEEKVRHLLKPSDVK
jgi:RNA polymerase sigma-70 factor (ECF subfamily)